MFSFKLPINVLRCRATKLFVVHTPALDLSSAGKTEAEALHKFGEATQLFLSELQRMGTLDEVLEEHGWSKNRKQAFPWVPPELLHHKSIAVKIPAHA